MKQIKFTKQSKYYFSQIQDQNVENAQKQTLEELLDQVDYEMLKQYNPKLYEQIKSDPQIILEMQNVIEQNEQMSQAQILKDTMEQSSEILAPKAPKVYTLPFVWSYFNPVFNVTAAYLIKLQFFTQIPWLYFIIMCGFGVRILLAPLMIRQMIVINKLSQASSNSKISYSLFKKSELNFFKRFYNLIAANLNYSNQTKTNLIGFFFYNLIQIPVFIVMVLSIRKISFENEDLKGAGILWFKDLNEPDPYLILPLIATILNYLNLGRGITKENEHWYFNRFRSFFQVLQIFHLPFTHSWPAGAFIYWISSSIFVFIQQTITRKPYILNKINPNFFADYSKMFGEKSKRDSENIIERVLRVEDPQLKSITNDFEVKEQLEIELQKFLSFQRQMKAKKITSQIKQGKQSKQ